MEANNNKITCPKCNSQNVQSEGMIHLCMDCGYKWEDEVQTDLGEMIIYQSDEGVRLGVRLENKTVWLNIEQIAQLFNKGRATISEHISNIFKEGELDEKVVCRKFRQTTQYGALEGKTQSKLVKYYNLDVIIFVGYRVKSIQGTCSVSFNYRIRFLHSPDSSSSAIAFDSFSHRIRLLQLTLSSHSGNSGVCVNLMKYMKLRNEVHGLVK